MFGLLTGSGIHWYRWLLQLRYEFRRIEQLDHTLFRGWKQYVKVFNVAVQTPFFEFREDPFRIVLVIRRANMVRPGGKPLHVVAQVVLLRNVAEFAFPIAFCAGLFDRISHQGRWFFGGRAQEYDGCQKYKNDKHGTTHQ